jgi:Xaa-Pro dipeptidase
MESDNVKLRKAVERMNQKGLNGLIIYSGGTASANRPSYLHYFSECKPLGPRNAAVLSKSGEMALLVEPKWDSVRAEKKSWIKDVRGSSDFIKDLRSILRDFKISGSIGLVGSKEMTQDVYAVVKKEGEVKGANDIIEGIARETTEKELAVIRKVCRIADIGFRAFMEYARVGTREYELVAETEFAMRAAGADDIFILMSSGRHNYEMHEPTDRRLKRGDIVIGEISPTLEGQFTQLCETVVLGEVSPIVAEKFNMLVRSLEESLKTMKSGAPASMVSVAMNRVISEAGYAEYCYPPYMRARGHGFGVGSIAPGSTMDEETKVNLEKDQVIVVHPNQYLPETGYLACGETVLVTDTGIERLTEIESKLYVKEG